MLFFSFLFLLGAGASPPAGQPMNLAPFGRLASFTSAGEMTPLDTRRLARGGVANAGIQWNEERDVRQIRVRFSGPPPSQISLQYWFHTWPYPKPEMPSIEDPVDDQWQGRWLTAATRRQCEGSQCVFHFEPLAAEENPLAANQPGVDYRRTLKMRLAAPAPLPGIESLQVFSGTREKPLRIRIGLGFATTGACLWTGSLAIQNGRVRAVRPWNFGAGDKMEPSGAWRFQTDGAAKGLDVDLIAAEPDLPGSLDETLVTVRGEARRGPSAEPRSFTFRIADLARGPIYVPALSAFVTTNLDGAFVSPSSSRKSIRQMIPAEPEQNYERASREIPPLDPWVRQWPGPLWVPLAADASWQKFAFEIGGNIYASKDWTKAMGRERARLQWQGDRLTWRIGVGLAPYYREDRKCAMTALDGYLPVVTQRFSRDGFDYEEEAFATLLDGRLDPFAAGRDEQTPAILIVTLRMRNTLAERRQTALWLDTAPDEPLELRGNGLYGGNGLRAVFEPRDRASVQHLPGGRTAARVDVPVEPGQTRAVVLKLPFVSGLTAAEFARLEAMDAAAERRRVVDYWKGVTAAATRFSIPEPNFRILSRRIAADIRISATRDPVTGLLMLPAASHIYKVYANETCFQTLLLDALGQHSLAEAYLEPLLRLQGSRTFPGLHRGLDDAIFHGVRVNPDYDYTASDYGLDHGAVLWALGEHYLYARDRAWFGRAWPPMRKAIDWIVTQRRSTMTRDPDGKPAPAYGLLPASSLEDNSDWAHWFAVNSFSWAGLDRAALALADLNHPEAGRVRREADAFLDDLRSAVIRATENAAVTRLRDGTYSPWVPVEPRQRLRRFGPIRVDYYKRYRITGQPNLRLSAIREALYGPIILLNLGVFQANEPIADWILDDWEDNLTLTSGLGLNVHGLTDERLWFSQGGMVFQANLQNPLLVYLKRRETQAAIRGAYNSFVSCFYPGPNVFTEEFRTWGNASGPFYKSPDESKFVHRLRDMLALENNGSLWLASGTPRAWLDSPEGIRADGLGTWFGPVSYWLRQTRRGVVEGEVSLPARNPARENWLFVRVPRGRISAVAIDGRNWTDFDPRRDAIRLPAASAPLRVMVRFE